MSTDDLRFHPLLIANARLVHTRTPEDKSERPGICQTCRRAVVWVYIEPEMGEKGGRFVPVDNVCIYVGVRPPWLDKDGRPVELFDEVTAVVGGEHRLRKVFSYASASDLVARELHHVSCPGATRG